MNVLIIYSTTEGQTGKVATFVADRIHDQGENVTLTARTPEKHTLTAEEPEPFARDKDAERRTSRTISKDG